MSDKQQQFRHEWVHCLMQNLADAFPQDAVAELMETCGRSCARHHAAAMIEQAQGSLETLAKLFAAQIGDENVRVRDHEYRLRYPKCYCPMVAGSPKPVPGVYCECGRGFVAETFSAVAGKPVEVRLASSIKRGDRFCEFVIRES